MKKPLIILSSDSTVTIFEGDSEEPKVSTWGEMSQMMNDFNNGVYMVSTMNSTGETLSPVRAIIEGTFTDGRAIVPIETTILWSKTVVAPD